MIELNHTIVPSHDKIKSAQFYARILGIKYEGKVAHFIAVRVNDALTLDFDNAKDFKPHHYAFKVSHDKFDEIFNNIKLASIPYGSGPFQLDDMKVSIEAGGRRVYFCDPNGHILELLTFDN